MSETITASNVQPRRRRYKREAVGLLRKKREEFNLSLRDVERVLGLSGGQLYRWEAGQAQPGVFYALLLARFYETTVEELFGHLLDKEDAS